VKTGDTSSVSAFGVGSLPESASRAFLHAAHTPQETTMNIRKLALIATFAALVIGAGLAHAGSVSNQAVTFSTTGGLEGASGSVRATRNTADAVQYIGCVRYAYDSGSNSALCYAKNSAGTVRQCTTNDPNMLRAAELMNPMSFLYFVVNTDGTCDRVIVTNTSFNL
jgi:hypothetical protein